MLGIFFYSHKTYTEKIFRYQQRICSPDARFATTDILMGSLEHSLGLQIPQIMLYKVCIILLVTKLQITQQIASYQLWRPTCLGE